MERVTSAESDQDPPPGRLLGATQQVHDSVGHG